MANNIDRWYFTKEQLDATQSRKCGYDSHKELSYRQQTANFIQDMGQKLKVTQLCINTAIVYMHRFYVFHSFTQFPWHQMAAASLFLAAKVEEQPRKLEYVIRVANMCRNNRDANIDVTSERYIAQSQDLIFNENVLLQTLGFDVAIDHPHTYVVKCCHLVRASKDLAQTSYFLASNSLHFTTMCLQYKPTVVACFCIHLACKWSSWEIPLSSEKKEWFLYVDPTVTTELLQQLTEEFLTIYDNCPSRLKDKIMSIGDSGVHTAPTQAMPNSPFDTDPKKIAPTGEQKELHFHRMHESKAGSDGDPHNPHKHRSSRPHDSSSSGGASQHQKERDYRGKLAQQHGLKSGVAATSTPVKQPPPHGHHRPSLDPKLKQQHSRPPSAHPQQPRSETRDILREAAARDSPFGIATKEYNKGKTDKDPSQKSQRDYLLKLNVSAPVPETSNYNGDNRANRPPSNKVPIKHEQARRHDEKTFVKPDGVTDSSNGNIGGGSAKRPSVPGHDRNSSGAYLNKVSAQPKVKSPFMGGDTTPKSVPRPPVTPQQPQQAGKQHHHNGTAGAGYGVQVKEDVPVKEELLIREETKTPVKKPSLFSPTKSPVSMKPEAKLEKTSPAADKSSNSFSFPALSPLNSPPNNVINKRVRNYSSGSEPELRPVLKKIDQVEGFENLLRDATIGINKLHQIPDIITPITDVVKREEPLSFAKEMKPPDIIPPLCPDSMSNQPLVNGIETNPVLISSLLKETPTVSHLPVVTNSTQKTEPITEEKTKEYHHKSKKKNKDKHKHKDKDKEKNREDKEKKKKHKDKDREKHKNKQKQEEPPEPAAEPIKIKIPKEKIQPVANLKIKLPIPKDIKTEVPTSGLKIKIPREVIYNCAEVEKVGRKRERNSPGEAQPPMKVSRSASHKDAKQNGRHSYKVTQLGDGDASNHRLAESKYINKSSS